MPAARDWLVAQALAGQTPWADDPFFAPLFDYSAENGYLADSAGRAPLRSRFGGV